MGIVAQQAMMNIFFSSFTITVGFDSDAYGVEMSDPTTPFFGDITPKPPKIQPEISSWISFCGYNTAVSTLDCSIQEYSLALVLANINSITIDGNTFLISARTDGFDVGSGVRLLWDGVANPFGTTIGATKILIIDYL